MTFESISSTVTNNKTSIALPIIDTVENNKSAYTQRKIIEAEISRKLQNTIGVTAKGLINVIDNNIVEKYPVQRQAIQDLVTIFGPSLPNLQGKNTRTTQSHVDLETITLLPLTILQRHTHIVLGMDVVKINGIFFFAKYSYIIKFSTDSELQDTKILTLVKILTTIKAIYSVWGFKIIVVAADNTFAPMNQDPTFIKLQMALNVTSEDEHEPYIERFNRTLKERCHVCFETLPF